MNIESATNILRFLESEISKIEEDLNNYHNSMKEVKYCGVRSIRYNDENGFDSGRAIEERKTYETAYKEFRKNLTNALINYIPYEENKIPSYRYY